MATLTLKQVPDELLERLREEASRQRRSINQQAVLLLDRALTPHQPSFPSALEAFYEREGRPESGVDDAFEGLRDTSPGREPGL